MALPTGFPAEDGSFNSVSFWELSPDGRYAPVVADGERTIVGQTVITRFTRPEETQVSALCSSSEAASLKALVGSSHSLVYHGGTVTAYLARCEVKHVDRFSIAEVTLQFII